MLENSTILPIGSVVLLNGGQKRVMIFGIMQVDETRPDMIFDYAGVPYPEGNMGLDYQYLFNHDEIAQVFFMGYSDDERHQFLARLAEHDSA